MTEDRAEDRPAARRGPLVSQRTAVVVIALLFGASAAGWLMTEFVPPDFPAHRDVYVQRWGAWTAGAVDALRLYDPFHSFWYTGVLALFFAVLLLCLAGRWRTFLLPSLRLPAPGALPGAGDLPRAEIRFGGPPQLEERADPVAHYGKRHGALRPLRPERLETALEAVRRILRSRGYRISERREGESLLFSAAAGRWRSLGSFVFHAGLLVITVGGVMGSRMGSSEILYGARGDVLPLGESDLRIRIDDFRIILTEEGRIRDYISTLALVDAGGNVVAGKEVEVNHPLRHAGYSILQSSYYIAEDEIEWARVAVAPEGGAPPVAVDLVPGERSPVPGTGLTLRPGRFKPDFRIIGGTPRSVSGMMNNPALEVIVEGPERGEAGWVFPLHPGFGTDFGLVSRIVVEDLEPRYYTGLEIAVNPGAAVLVTGMVMASAGLLALMLWHHRVLRGRIDGDGVTIVGISARWKVSFREEIARTAREIEAALAGADGRRRKDRSG